MALLGVAGDTEAAGGRGRKEQHQGGTPPPASEL